MKLEYVSRDELLKLVSEIDDETKTYCIDDCIKCWDDKKLWGQYPFALLSDEGELLSVVFYSAEQYMQNYNIAYIQRLFTPLKHRNKGYFSHLITQLHTMFFDLNFDFIQMFIDKKVSVYRKLNFKTLFDTRDCKYEFCLHPVFHNNIKKNNELVIKEGIYNFYSIDILQYIEHKITKYV